MNEYIPVGIKLTSGEEIFASIESMDELGNVEISKTYKIIRMFEQGKDSVESKLLYEPWMDFCEGNLHITRQNIIVCEPLKPRLVQLYLEMITNVTNMIKNPSEQKIAGEEPIKNDSDKPLLH